MFTFACMCHISAQKKNDKKKRYSVYKTSSAVDKENASITPIRSDATQPIK